MTNTSQRAARASIRSVVGTTALLALSLCTGCVERWLYIRTEPVGAQVFVDGQDVGPSPARVSFDHYGHREILVRAQNHTSKSAIAHVHAPWYQWFPFDLVSEHLWPWTLVDQHNIVVKLDPVDTDALLESLETLSNEIEQQGLPKIEDESTNE